MPALPSVLIVDDDAESRVLLGQLLTALGADKVSDVASAEEALELLTRESFSIILSDYRLEGMDGVEFLDRIRQSGEATPVVLITGAPEQQAGLRASKHAKVDVFPKPFRIAELRAAMDRLLAA